MKYLIVFLFACTAFADVTLDVQWEVPFTNYRLSSEDGEGFTVYIDDYTYYGCSSPYEYKVLDKSIYPHAKDVTVIKEDIPVCKARVSNPFKMGVIIRIEAQPKDSSYLSSINLLVTDGAEVKVVSDSGVEQIIAEKSKQSPF